MGIKKFILKNFSEIFVILIAFCSGIVLTFSTFISSDNKLFIASKAWSDFASHIPLIRSFSLGVNFPPQYPLFPGEPIKYHFLFYSIVGFLEKFGIRIDIALNMLSFLGFAGLIIIIYILAKEIFKSKTVGVLSVILFLFNSSLSFIYFFKNHPINDQLLNALIINKDFQSFAPYGTGIISAFWNLNIYTNQRHLALSFALSLGLIYFLIKYLNNKKTIKTGVAILIGVAFGLLFFLHVAVFLMTAIVIACVAILFPKIRKSCLIILFFAALLAFPQYQYLISSPGYQMHPVVGYLVSENLTLNKFLEFWIYNLGLSIILIPLGFIFASKFQKKILLSFLTLFFVGNLIQFSPEIAANHKFFNYFLLVGNMFSAYLLIKLWNRKTIFKPFAAILFFFMIFGGIIDLFPIINDEKIAIADYKADPRSSWILENTPQNSIFLNTTLLYNPASLVGRRIFMGWPYFAWSQGYDTNQRGMNMEQMLSANSKKVACDLLKQNSISFVEIQIQNPPDPNIPAISNIYRTDFIKVYENGIQNYSIYDIKKSCN